MTPTQFRAARETLGYTQSELARAMGYSQGNFRQISDMETGRKAIHEIPSRLIRMFLIFGVPKEFMGK